MAAVVGVLAAAALPACCGGGGCSRDAPVDGEGEPRMAACRTNATGCGIG